MLSRPTLPTRPKEAKLHSCCPATLKLCTTKATYAVLALLEESGEAYSAIESYTASALDAAGLDVHKPTHRIFEQPYFKEIVETIKSLTEQARDANPNKKPFADWPAGLLTFTDVHSLANELGCRMPEGRNAAGVAKAIINFFPKIGRSIQVDVQPITLQFQHDTTGTPKTMYLDPKFPGDINGHKALAEQFILGQNRARKTGLGVAVPPGSSWQGKTNTLSIMASYAVLLGTVLDALLNLECAMLAVSVEQVHVRIQHLGRERRHLQGAQYDTVCYLVVKYVHQLVSRCLPDPAAEVPSDTMPVAAAAPPQTAAAAPAAAPSNAAAAAGPSGATSVAAAAHGGDPTPLPAAPPPPAAGDHSQFPDAGAVKSAMGTIVQRVSLCTDQTLRQQANNSFQRRCHKQFFGDTNEPFCLCKEYAGCYKHLSSLSKEAYAAAAAGAEGYKEQACWWDVTELADDNASAASHARKWAQVAFARTFMLAVGLRTSDIMAKTVFDMPIKGTGENTDNVTLFEAGVFGGFKGMTDTVDTGCHPLQYCHKSQQQTKRADQAVQAQDVRLAGLCILNMHTRLSIALAYLDTVREYRIFNPFKQAQVIHSLHQYISGQQINVQGMPSATDAQRCSSVAGACASVDEAIRKAQQLEQCIRSLLQMLHPQPYARCTAGSSSGSGAPARCTAGSSSGNDAPTGRRTSRARKPSSKAAAEASAAAGNADASEDASESDSGDEDEGRQQRGRRDTDGKVAAAIKATEDLLTAADAAALTTAAARPGGSPPSSDTFGELLAAVTQLEKHAHSARNAAIAVIPGGSDVVDLTVIPYHTLDSWGDTKVAGQKGLPYCATINNPQGFVFGLPRGEAHVGRHTQGVRKPEPTPDQKMLR